MDLYPTMKRILIMKYLSRYVGFGIILFALIASSSQAGGLYPYELGNTEVGLAAAGWSARAQDAAIVFTNPAGMVRLQKSELLVGVQPLYLHAEFSPDSNTSISGSDGDASTWLPAGGVDYVHNLMPKSKLSLPCLRH
jgi:long-chain fatty acid transport protein